MIETTYDKYLQTLRWKKKRLQRLAAAELRDDPPAVRCDHCKLWFGAQYAMRNQQHEARFAAIHVHHKTYERLGRELNDDLSVLCESCHGVEHGFAPRVWWRNAQKDVQEGRYDVVTFGHLRLYRGHHSPDEVMARCIQQFFERMREQVPAALS